MGRIRNIKKIYRHIVTQLSPTSKAVSIHFLSRAALSEQLVFAHSFFLEHRLSTIFRSWESELGDCGCETPARIWKSYTAGQKCLTVFYPRTVAVDLHKPCFDLPDGKVTGSTSGLSGLKPFERAPMNGCETLPSKFHMPLDQGMSLVSGKNRNIIEVNALDD